MTLRELMICSLAVTVYGSGVSDDVHCTPKAKLPHPIDCSKYYICDEFNNPSTFQCPEDYLYNPDTTSCDHSERVTCFSATTEDKETTPGSDKDEDYEGEELVYRKENESDLHKEFYLVSENNSSNEESDLYEGSTEGTYEGIRINNKELSESEEGGLVGSEKGQSYQSHTTLRKNQERGSIKSEELFQKKPDNEKVTLPSVSSEVSGESLYNINKDNNGDKTTSLGQAETIYLHPVDYEAAVEDEQATYRGLLIKRQTSLEDLTSNETNTKVTAITSQEIPDKGTDDLFPNSHSTINIAMTSKNETKPAKMRITNINGTSILQLSKTGEQLGNWSEQVQSDWTDLKIFWQHPTNKDFKGSVHFQYPPGDMSDESEIKSLLLEILKIGGEEEDLKDDTTVDKNKTYPKNSYEGYKDHGNSHTIIEPDTTGQELSSFQE